jgi:ribosomal protein L35AE/L33A
MTLNSTAFRLVHASNVKLQNMLQVYKKNDIQYYNKTNGSVDEGNIENVHPSKNIVNLSLRLRWQWFSRGENFQYYPQLHELFI